jgi:hypothetical protein
MEADVQQVEVINAQRRISPIETLPFEPEDWLLMECPK